MKKTKRTLLCLMLAVLMVASCALTAMAASGSSTALVNGTNYSYRWSLTPGTTSGSGSMSTTATPTNLTVKVRNYLYSEENDKSGYGAWASNTGYSSVTATANNILVIGIANVPSSVVSMDGNFYINSVLVNSQYKVV